MQKLLLVVALSVALVGSATAARPAQTSDSMCSLPAQWDQVDFAAQAFASMNSFCPSAAGVQTEEDNTCVPCVCGAYHLFSDALDHPMIRGDSRSKMTNPMSISLFGEVFTSCIDNNAKKFLKPLEIQAGLSDCLSSTDSPVKNGAQLAALCATWSAQSLQGSTTEAEDNQSNVNTHTQEDQEVHAEEQVEVQAMDVIPEAHVVEDRVRSMLHNARMMQEESSAGGETSFEESSGTGVLPVYPPVYPPSYGVYPPPRGVYPPPPAPPSPGSAAAISVAGMTPLIMALVSAFLMATMML